MARHIRSAVVGSRGRKGEQVVAGATGEWPAVSTDVHKSVAITNVDLPQRFGVTGVYPAMAFGAACATAWLVGIPAVSWKVRYKASDTLQKLGPVRYWITAFFFMAMMGTVVKVMLRLMFNIKYIMVGPMNFNI